jgi:NADP-dependent 3-hydroxy acid dehydrogenase YdfG
MRWLVDGIGTPFFQNLSKTMNRKGRKRMTMKGKVALVTGAGSGLGEAAARLLAQEGVQVALVGRTGKEVEEVAASIQDDGGEALAVIADISDAGTMQKAVQKVIKQWEQLDIVFANAGINGVWAPIEELKPEEWRATININLNGTFYTCAGYITHPFEIEG